MYVCMYIHIHLVFENASLAVSQSLAFTIRDPYCFICSIFLPKSLNISLELALVLMLLLLLSRISEYSQARLIRRISARVECNSNKHA